MIGQEEAVTAISKAVKRSRVGLKDPSRPIATMLFCGPTGVGKTELAKSLAASYFGSVRFHRVCCNINNNEKTCFICLYLSFHIMFSGSSHGSFRHE